MNSDDFAVVVGLSKYYELGEPPPHLKGPENDADLVHAWLVDSKGGGLPVANVSCVKSSEFVYPDPDPGAVTQPDRGRIERLFLKLDQIAAKL